MADSGLRRAEVIALKWGDVDMMNGLGTVKRGKGGKARSGVIGATTRRVLLHTGGRWVVLPAMRLCSSPAMGCTSLAQVSLSYFAGSKVDWNRRHAPCAETNICDFSLRAGMDVLHLGRYARAFVAGHGQHYAQMIDEDLL